MFKKTIRYLSEVAASRDELLKKLSALRKAYDALDRYCDHILARLDALEVENANLHEEREDAKWQSRPAKD